MLGLPLITEPGYPIESRSKVQPPASFLMRLTMLGGSSDLPDGNFTLSDSPVVQIFTFVPPMSTTRMFTRGLHEWESFGLRLRCPVHSACRDGAVGTPIASREHSKHFRSVFRI